MEATFDVVGKDLRDMIEQAHAVAGQLCKTAAREYIKGWEVELEVSPLVKDYSGGVNSWQAVVTCTIEWRNVDEKSRA